MRLYSLNSGPASEAELLQRCEAIEGLSFAQLAAELSLTIPEQAARRKGWAGMAIEQALGTTAGCQPVPDFKNLGIELKTIPLSHQGTPAESTFVTSIPLMTIHQQQWHNSQCFEKLKRVLWIPVEGDNRIPFEQRRIGRGILWSPDAEEEAILASDWHELTTMIATGRLEEIDATFGHYLQVRPKAANTRSLCYGFDSEGNKILTLPRGFYLRTAFTRRLLGLS
ncbi:DNA mismatch repair endonuclease MutH [Legionella taurinensis]|uniref:DNA mismatch repair protein MutH n=1 Tax=Legionella taurinensis TaxID=70611 RepID=A0A3A5L9M6_9GAMM|nr:DNA mismatch repair endonuclease MutH [Legionella taurinensis]MDX1838313.1 DNA mismatch repair endonuclease MutH [Legionella taurinensis]PUT39199.1 DNA mismatch repair endonuclease MutH [Legionella taurinensis]PUT39532.1 DNA mismatch repair endonuclease MutH [Legionella taurinensis]PUT43965.1 DNA mismatch repair endonuclease MutH [Legionella taurinensis]PUT45035.1 DNA mismatch repair endonuclease MutH [Legionella taurinensis]